MWWYQNPYGSCKGETRTAPYTPQNPLHNELVVTDCRFPAQWLPASNGIQGLLRPGHSAIGRRLLDV